MSNNPTSASGASGSGSGRANTDMNAAALLERIPSYTPQLTHPTSALAALLHAASVVRGLAPVEALPQGTEDAYVLRYGAVRVRVGRMGAFLQIDVVQGDEPPASFSMRAEDVFDPAAFPVTTANATDATSLGFRSVEVAQAIVDQYDKLLSRIGSAAPSSTAASGVGEVPRGDGARDGNPAQAPAQPDSEEPARATPLVDPVHPSLTPAVPPAGVPAASIGHRDLDPLAGAGIGGGPGALGVGAVPGRGGGMIVDFNHPLFDSRRDGTGRRDDGPGGLANPPGARWDPVGPGVGGFPRAGGNPLGGVGVGDGVGLGRDWGDEMPPPGEEGPDPLGLGRRGAPGGLGEPGFPGLGGPGLGGPGGLGGRGGRGGFGGSGGFGGGFTGGFGGGGII